MFARRREGHEGHRDNAQSINDSTLFTILHT